MEYYTARKKPAPDMHLMLSKGSQTAKGTLCDSLYGKFKTRQNEFVVETSERVSREKAAGYSRVTERISAG